MTNKRGYLWISLLCSIAGCLFIILPDMHALAQAKYHYQRKLCKKPQHSNAHLQSYFAVNHHQDFLRYFSHIAAKEGVSILVVRSLAPEVGAITEKLHVILTGTLSQLLSLLSATNGLPFVVGIESFHLEPISFHEFRLDLHWVLNTDFFISKKNYQFETNHLNHIFTDNKPWNQSNFNEISYSLEQKSTEIASVHEMQFSGVIEQGKKIEGVLQLTNHHLLVVHLGDIVGKEKMKLVAISASQIIFQNQTKQIKIKANF